MAGKGRCAGCEKTGTASAIARHIVDCPDWNALPRDQALSPEAAHERWVSGGQRAERDQRKSATIEENTARREQSSRRFAVSRTDITLEDPGRWRQLCRPLARRSWPSGSGAATGGS